MVLIVDDDRHLREALELLLGDHYETVSVDNGLEAVEVVKNLPVNVVLMDINLPKVDGLKALDMIKDVDPDVGVVMLSATDSAQKAVQALRMGAYDYITKPFEEADLLATLQRYTDGQTLRREIALLREELHNKLGDKHFICRSPAMRRVMDMVEKVGKSSSNVLITGESGTGKELVARAIHSLGDRREKPFVAVNCGAIPGELMESELFGHEKGAFTGAYKRKIGKLEYADGGTVFLDEISSMPLKLQAKLLRVLQEKSFERVGSLVPIKVDIRVIAATNTDLEQAVKQGEFRDDLYYRLRVIPIVLPPLRERREDIPLLASHFLDRFSKRYNKSIRRISPDALDVLSEYGWPGNVRELENLMERIVVLAREGSEITTDDLPVEIFFKDVEDAGGSEPLDFKGACRAFERRYIVGVLKKTNWNRSEAARELKIHRNTLLMKMKELDIKRFEGGR
ncbi:MAG TPA: sigma-54-dependent Fis family transcriptional regulator [Deltaproteobacteria bacterium]|nr:sigma-54-dependent Fis family transcriptional regulator [Deltaproteobacteria bacterium]